MKAYVMSVLPRYGWLVGLVVCHHRYPTYQVATIIDGNITLLKGSIGSGKYALTQFF